MFGGARGLPSCAGTLLYEGHPPLNLCFRPLRHCDYDALKAIHRELFPIDYEEIFFRKAVAGEDRVFSWAAVHNHYGVEHLVGFVTARLVYLYECDPVDRTALGLASHALDGHCCVYVLTLGVVPGCRQCGVARTLLDLVAQHAARMRCRAIFLHVISYNNAAMRLYGNAGYQAMAQLPNFYHLVTGRQPNPDQSWYDAFLYATFLPSTGPEPSPAMQWAGGVLGAAVAPLRSVLGTFNGCMPTWLCRQTYSTFLPFPGPGLAQTSSKGSLADTATSGWEPPPAVPPVPPPPPSSARFQGDPSTGSRCDSCPSWQTHGLAQAPEARFGDEGSWGSCAGPTVLNSIGGGSGGGLQSATEPRHRRQYGRSLSSGSGGGGLGGSGGVGGGQGCAVAEGYRNPSVANGDSGLPFRPPSPQPQPPLPSRAPNYSSSVQHRHAHGPGGGHRGHQGHCNGQAAPQPYPQHHSRAARHSSGGGGRNYAGMDGGHGHGGSQPLGRHQCAQQLNGRDDEKSGMGRAPHGLAGGGLHQSQRQQRGGSLLASLFRPPGDSPYPPSR